MTDTTESKVGSESQRLEETELFTRVEALVAKRLDSEREFLRSTIGLSIKIAGFAIGAAVTVLTIVGIRNIGDIRANVNESARTAIQDYVKTSAAKDVQEQLDRIYARALINFYLQQADLEKDVTDDPIKVSYAEAAKMLSLVSDPKSTDYEFYGALEVLRSTQYASWWSQLSQEFQNLISADGTSGWLKKRPVRWAAIIRCAGDAEVSEVQQAVRDDMEDTRLPEEVMLAALTYMNELGKTVTEDRYESLANQEDASIRDGVMPLLATQYPSNQALAKWIRDNQTGRVTRNVEAITQTMSALYKGGSAPPLVPGPSRQDSLGASLLGVLVDNDVRVRDIVGDGFFGRDVVFQKRRSLARSQASWGAVRRFGRLLLETRAQHGDFDTFKQCLAALTLGAPGGGHAVSVRATLREGGSVVTSVGDVQQSDVPEGSLLLVSQYGGPSGNPKCFAVGLKGGSADGRAEVLGFKGAGRIELSLELSGED